MKKIAAIFCFIAVAFTSAAQYLHIVQKLPDCVYGLQDDEGKWVTQPVYEKIWMLDKSAGLLIYSRSGNVSGLLDGKTGKEITAAKYGNIHRIENLSPEYFVFALEDSPNKKGILDRSGHEIIPGRYEIIRYDSASQTFAAHLKGGTRLIDLTGRTISDSSYLQIYDFHEGTAVVSRISKPGNQTSFGMINIRGKEIVPPVYDEFEQRFGSGVAFRKEKDWGFIDSTGKITVPFTLKKISAQWLSPIQAYHVTDKNDKAGMVDKNGHWLIKPEYDRIDDFTTQLTAIAEKNKKSFLIRSDGSVIKSSASDTLLYGDIFKKYVLFRTDSHWGIASSGGPVILPAIHDACGIITEFGKPDFAWVLEKKEISFYDLPRDANSMPAYKYFFPEPHTILEGSASVLTNEHSWLVFGPTAYTLEDAGGSIRVRDDKKRTEGLIDYNGNWIVPVQYTHIARSTGYSMDFVNEDEDDYCYYALTASGKFAVYSDSGKKQIDTLYNDISPREKKYGYRIALTGKRVFTGRGCEHPIAGWENLRWYFIDARNVALPLDENYKQPQLMDRYVLFTDKNGSQSIYDPLTYQTVATSLHDVYPEGNGIFGAANASGLRGLIDSTGKIILPYRYKHISMPFDGWRIAETTDGKFDLLNRSLQAQNEKPVSHFEDFPFDLTDLIFGSSYFPKRDCQSMLPAHFNDSVLMRRANNFLFGETFLKKREAHKWSTVSTVLKQEPDEDDNLRRDSLSLRLAGSGYGCISMLRVERDFENIAYMHDAVETYRNYYLRDGYFHAFTLTEIFAEKHRDEARDYIARILQQQFKRGLEMDCSKPGVLPWDQFSVSENGLKIYVFVTNDSGDLVKHAVIIPFGDLREWLDRKGPLDASKKP